ncbi:ArsR/SmtB family transcription factor [Goekera deserti]|uniref:ArsR/SmtB family transcription factor n=1 Tax=Goekera deserti TaxID=2497753 RepID=UPI001F2CD163|nr:metalloregulator ArsR/SmtB family transcription factor [Goekera deserti]
MDTRGTPTTVPAACCPPAALAAGLSGQQAADLARRLKALADPARLRLLSLIAGSPAGEACVCDLTDPLGLTQPTVSHHLKVLVDAGFLARDKRGVWAWFSIVPGAMETVAALLPGAVPARA